VSNELGVRTIRYDFSLRSQLLIFITSVIGETPLVRYKDLLSSRELELATSKKYNQNLVIYDYLIIT
jgi:hypothetical protein